MYEAGDRGAAGEDGRSEHGGQSEHGFLDVHATVLRRRRQAPGERPGKLR
jgi:hypothetical protein